MSSTRRYFLLVFALSVPFWILGYVVERLPIPINLPVSALMAFMPATAALICTAREGGRDGAAALLRRVLDFRKAGALWLAVAFVFMPAALFLAWLLMRLAGAPLPEPRIVLGALPIFFVMFLIGAIGEELGWQGYVYDRMEARSGALEAALVLGMIWAVWHVIPYLQTKHSAEWTAWHLLATPLSRVVTVWLYLNARRSVFAVILFHAMSNVGYYLFPNYGSHYDPFYFFWIAAASVLAIVAFFGPALARTPDAAEMKRA